MAAGYKLNAYSWKFMVCIFNTISHSQTHGPEGCLLSHIIENVIPRKMKHRNQPTLLPTNLSSGPMEKASKEIAL
jgi:hypothetical protein